MTRTKTVIGYLALLLSIVGIAGGVYLQLFASPWIVRSDEITAYAEPIVERLQSDGLTPDINEYLASAGHKPKGWLATVILHRTDSLQIDTTGEAVASSNPLLVGLGEWEIIERLSPAAGSGTVGGTSRAAITPDGDSYWVAVYDSIEYVPGISWLVGTVPFYSIIGAWLAIAAWIALDVRERQKANVVAWTLLSLLAAPVTLGVWLISRSRKYKSEQVLCPSCGSNVPEDAAYCVRCGHQVLALCPKCGRRVDLDWSFCGSCGASLIDEA